jgi:hypothetical protein
LLLEEQEGDEEDLTLQEVLFSVPLYSPFCN